MKKRAATLALLLTLCALALLPACSLKTYFFGTAESAEFCPKTFPELDPKEYRSPNIKKPVKYLILAIGDGFGPAQLEAAFGAALPPPFDQFPHRGKVTHCSLSGITDSAAAVTAMATGVKTLNERLAVDEHGQVLKTILESSQERGFKTGLVTTTEITHATPAGFAAHNLSRHDKKGIALDYLEKTRPDLLLGGGWLVFQGLGVKGSLPAKRLITWRDYTVTTTRLTLNDIDRNSKVLGVFAPEHLTWEVERRLDSTEPKLTEMTEAALKFLDGPQGFFLMVEGGRIDHAGHQNNLSRLGPEVKEFARAVALLLEWTQMHPEALLLVTADHETGGLKKVGDQYEWSTVHHTDTPVWLFGMGPNADVIRETQDNRAIYHMMREALGY